MLECDMAVIGGGSAGLTAAKFGARFGKEVVLVEKLRLGGDCTWTGCVPSKALIRSARAAHALREAPAFGIRAFAGDGEAEAMGQGDSAGRGMAEAAERTDMPAVKERLRAIQKRIYQEDDSAEALAAVGVRTIMGGASFRGPRELAIQGTDGRRTRLLARAGVVVATGGRPRQPRIAGIDDVPYLTYETVFDIDVLPRSLTVVGGGPIGSELAQAFARLGSRVTIVAKQLVAREEPEARDVLGAKPSCLRRTLLVSHASPRRFPLSGALLCTHSCDFFPRALPKEAVHLLSPQKEALCGSFAVLLCCHRLTSLASSP